MAKEDNKKDDVKKDDRLKALDAALSQIEKQYGKGSVMKLGDTSHMQVETVPTGSLSLDIALGAGGVPKGRIVEALRDLLMQSMRLIRSMQEILVWILIISTFPSRTMGNRHWRSLRPWCVLEQWIL